MKKYTFTIVMILTSFLLMSQVYLPPQDFGGEEFPPEGWTLENGGAENTFEPGPMPLTTEPSCAWIETSANMEIDDRIISPLVDIPAGAESKIFAQLRGSVGYAIAQYWDPDNEVRYFIEISTDNGASWTTLLDLDDPASVQAAGSPFPWDDWNWFDVAIDISDYAGQSVMVCFHHEKEFVPTGGGSFGVTNFGIWEDVQDDVQLLDIDVPFYAVVNSDVEIGGTVKNLGSNEVTSFEGEYHINGELVETFEMTGLNIAPFANYPFIAGNPASFDNVEIHNVELMITKVNGVEDATPENSTLSQQISIASEIVDRKPMFETFTSSTCGPCFEGNIMIDGVLVENPGAYSLVKYQVDWPGVGDPYYIEDNGIRVDYYNIGGVPSFLANGYEDYSPYDFNQYKFNLAANEESFVGITMSHIYDGLEVSVNVDVDPKLNIDDASVHMAVVEKTTFNNTGSNGETEFHNVVMAMLPDGHGTSTSFTAGETVSFEENKNLITTFIEEFDDLMLVAWVQDNMTHSVLQSESYDLSINVGVENGEFQNISLFPNPTNGIFTIIGTDRCNIKIVDIAGREVFSQNSVTDYTSINITNLDRGVYFVNITEENKVVYTQKIILK